MHVLSHPLIEIEELMNLKLELTLNNRYVTCEIIDWVCCLTKCECFARNVAVVKRKFK